MTTEHPITPPLELVRQWHKDYLHLKVTNVGCHEYIATQATRWGADQELEACCEWLQDGFGDIGDFPEKLRAARRPKPPSLAEEALKALQNQIDTSFKISSEAQERADTIRAALERLKELENGNE